MIRDLLFLNNMIVPKLITFFYWLLLLLVIFIGIGTMAADGFFFGLIFIAGGIFLARVWSELVIVLFKINDALQEIRRR